MKGVIYMESISDYFHTKYHNNQLLTQVLDTRFL